MEPHELKHLAVLGGWLIVRGVREHQRAARELALFDEARQLPEARLVRDGRRDDE